MSEQENLSQHPLFLYLQNNPAVAGLLDDAAKEKFIICVPNLKGLIKGTKITKKWALQHVLVRQGPTSKIYKSLGGGTLELGEDGKTLNCQKGYSEAKRTSQILFEETHYNDDFDSFQVVCVSVPFEGKYLEYTSNDEERKIMERAECRSMVEHRDFLVSLLGSQFVTSVVYRNNTLLEFQGGFEKLLSDSLSNDREGLEQVQQAVSTVCDRLFRDIGREFMSKIKDEDCVSLYDAVYSMVNSDLHGHLFEAIKYSVYARQRDAKLAQIMKRVATVKLSDLGVEPPLSSINVDAAVTMIEAISGERTPLLKLKCVRDVEEFLIAEIGAVMKQETLNKKNSSQPVTPQLGPTMTPTSSSSAPISDALQHAMAQFAVDLPLPPANSKPPSTPSSVKETNSASDDAEHTTPSGNPAATGQGVSTDDVLPFFVYVLIKSNVEFPVATLLYISHFLPPIRSPKLDVLLAHLQAAVGYVELDELHIAGPLKYTDESKKNLAVLLGMSQQDSESAVMNSGGTSLFSSPLQLFNSNHRLSLTGNSNLFSVSSTPFKPGANSAFSPSPSPSSVMPDDDVDDEFQSSSAPSNSSSASSAPSASSLLSMRTPPRKTSAIGISPASSGPQLSGLSQALQQASHPSLAKPNGPPSASTRTRGSWRSKSVGDVLVVSDMFESKTNRKSVSLLNSLTGETPSLLADSNKDEGRDTFEDEDAAGEDETDRLAVPDAPPKHKRAVSTHVRSRNASILVKQKSKVTIDPLSLFKSSE